MLIIGGGVGGLGLALESLKKGIPTTVLDNGFNGTTHAATGILDARPDHLIKDVESVIATATEVKRWQDTFSQKLVKPELFHLLLGQNSKYGIREFESLFEYYCDLTQARAYGLPDNWTTVPISNCEKSEPNLRKDYFTHSIKFWLWTVNPDALLAALREECSMFSPLFKRVVIKKIKSYTVKDRLIKEVTVETKSGEVIKIDNGRLSPIVNTAGPWINNVLLDLGIKIPLELDLGVQVKVPGFHLGSGLLTFAEDGKYSVLLQIGDYLQAGPTNTNFGNSPRLLNKEEETSAISYISDILKKVFDPKHHLPQISILKYGWRVRPKGMVDTDRPIVWRHDKEGIDNLYTLLPGKMVLGLLAGRELLSRAVSDGVIKIYKGFRSETSLTLNGYEKTTNNIMLIFWKISSLCKLAWRYLKTSH